MPQEQRASIKDVARLAGVSPTTVSDALSGRGRLPDGTRTRVREAAERLNYRPSALARGLRSRRGGLLGLVIVPSPSASLSTVAFWMTLLSNAAEASLAKGYALVLLPPDPQLLSPMQFPIDGVIVIDPVRDDPVLKVLRQEVITAVTFGRDLSGSPEPWVDDDIPAGVSSLLETVTKPGDRVALVTFPAAKSYLQDILSGVMAWPGHAAGYPIIHTINSTQTEDIRMVTARLMADPPDLLLGANDRITLALLGELTAAGVNIPDDIRLASLVDAPELERSTPTISALAQHPAEAARRAIDGLIDRIAGKEMPAATVIPMQVLPRASAPAISKARVRARARKPQT